MKFNVYYRSGYDGNTVEITPNMKDEWFALPEPKPCPFQFKIWSDNPGVYGRNVDIFKIGRTRFDAHAFTSVLCGSDNGNVTLTYEPRTRKTEVTEVTGLFSQDECVEALENLKKATIKRKLYSLKYRDALFYISWRIMAKIDMGRFGVICAVTLEEVDQRIEEHWKYLGSDEPRFRHILKSALDGNNDEATKLYEQIVKLVNAIHDLQATMVRYNTLLAEADQLKAENHSLKTENHGLKAKLGEK